MAGKRSPIVPHFAGHDGAILAADASLAAYDEFKAWVRTSGESDVTYYPLRQVGKELTLKSVTQTKVV